ncbi:MAG: S1C family serine protease [Acidimicrobiia bacterium]|nr:S1C family serine protease [Acidimicrobiia bacterium]
MHHDAEGGDVGGYLPDRLDRPWLHPSELSPGPVRQSSPPGSGLPGAGTAAPPLGRRARSRPGPVLGTALVAALAAALVVLSEGLPAGDPAATAVTPSVVAVRVTGPGGSGEMSGVCVAPGYVLTSDGFVDDDVSVLVSTESREDPAALVGRDPRTGLALLEVGTDAPAARFGTSRALRVGHPVVVVLAPARPSSTRPGYVAGLGELVRSSRGATLAGLIEARVRGGAPAGSPVVDEAGNVVGILAAVPGPDGDHVMAVPAEIARDVADQLRTTGSVAHGWLGIRATDAAGGDGAEVRSVARGGPAAAAGLAPGDVVLRVGGDAVTSTADLLVAVRARRPGDVVPVTFRRDGTEAVTTAVLDDAPDGADGSATREPASPGAS